jgi:hypothetical protein
MGGEGGVSNGRSQRRVICTHAHVTTRMYCSKHVTSAAGCTSGVRDCAILSADICGEDAVVHVLCAVLHGNASRGVVWHAAPCSLPA